MGSPALGALIAQIAFVILMVYGWVSGRLRRRGLIVFALLWLGGRFGLPYVPPYGAALIPSFVAILDIALVLIIFKGDVRIT
jgi:hypothetical protein